MKTSIIHFSKIIVLSIFCFIFNSCSSEHLQLLPQETPHESDTPEASSEGPLNSPLQQDPSTLTHASASSAAADNPNRSVEVTVTILKMSGNAFTQTLTFNKSALQTLTFGALLSNLNTQIEGINLSTLEYGAWNTAEDKIWLSEAASTRNIYFQFSLGSQLLGADSRLTITGDGSITITAIVNANLVTDPNVLQLKENHPGSSKHPFECRPCHFQGELCWKGMACSLCHACPKPKRKSKHQRDVEKRRQARLVNLVFVGDDPVDADAQPSAPSDAAAASIPATPTTATITPDNPDNNEEREQSADREQQRIQANYAEFLSKSKHL